MAFCLYYYRGKYILTNAGSTVVNLNSTRLKYYSRICGCSSRVLKLFKLLIQASMFFQVLKVFLLGSLINNNFVHSFPKNIPPRQRSYFETDNNFASQIHFSYASRCSVVFQRNRFFLARCKRVKICADAISCQGMEAFSDFRLRDIKGKNKRNNSTQSH